MNMIPPEMANVKNATCIIHTDQIGKNPISFFILELFLLALLKEF